MSDEEKQSHADLIEEIIGKKMKPLYWMFGIALTIMVGIYIVIALPISTMTINLGKEIQQKADKQYVIDNYLTRGNYLFLQSQCHQADVEAIRNPQNADLIYNKEINEAGKTLEFISRSGERINN